MTGSPSSDQEFREHHATRAEFEAADQAAPGLDQAPAPAAPPAPPVDPAIVARAAVNALCTAMIRPSRPRLAAVWSEQKRADVAHALAPIIARYDHLLGPWLAKYGDWLSAALVVGPLVVDSIDAYRLDAADEQREQATPPASKASAPPAAPPADSPLAAFPIVATPPA